MGETHRPARLRLLAYTTRAERTTPDENLSRLCWQAIARRVGNVIVE